MRSRTKKVVSKPNLRTLKLEKPPGDLLLHRWWALDKFRLSRRWLWWSHNFYRFTRRSLVFILCAIFDGMEIASNLFFSSSLFFGLPSGFLTNLGGSGAFFFWWRFRLKFVLFSFRPSSNFDLRLFLCRRFCKLWNTCLENMKRSVGNKSEMPTWRLNEETPRDILRRKDPPRRIPPECSARSSTSSLRTMLLGRDTKIELQPTWLFQSKTFV